MYSLYYTAFLNMNSKGASFAHAHTLPLIASGDLHTLDWFDKDFTWIRCDHNLESLFQVFAQFKQHHLTNDQLGSLFKIKTAPLEQKKFKKEAFKIIRKILKHYSLHPWHLLPKR